MASTVAVIQHRLREIRDPLRFLAERLGPGTDTYKILMGAHEIVAADAEHLTPVTVFLRHLVREATRAQALVKRTGGA